MYLKYTKPYAAHTQKKTALKIKIKTVKNHFGKIVTTTKLTEKMVTCNRG